MDIDDAVPHESATTESATQESATQETVTTESVTTESATTESAGAQPGIPAVTLADESAVPKVTLADVEVARRALVGTALVTPMEGSRWLSSLTGQRVSIKCENLQRTGSFKIRGAYLRISNLGEDERARGVVAASAGNHAQGVALAATLLGIKST
ncbi:MAG: pyridoxal-phosphate dependent enzyme, partial [Actinomycetota bacterium]|nr:pyridoxal-phosphate dependent enzyme [Actinomycetota bacterium]